MVEFGLGVGILPLVIQGIGIFCRIRKKSRSINFSAPRASLSYFALCHQLVPLHGRIIVPRFSVSGSGAAIGMICELIAAYGASHLRLRLTDLQMSFKRGGRC